MNMKITLHAIVALFLATTLTASAQRPQGRPGGPEQNRLPEGARTERDLVYGSAGGRELKLNLYLPPGDEAKPLIIWIHGGAWLQGSKDGPSPAQQFVGSGYAVAHVGYRLSQVAKWPAQMHDCKAAVRWLRANAARYHLDPKRFAAWGSSAGGHLVAVLGTSGGVAELEGTCNELKTSSSVQAVVDWFGPTDFLQMNKFRSNIAHDEARSPESQLIGGPIQENKDATAKANPITYVERGEALPHFLIMHGTKDDLVPFNQSELLNEALKAAKADVTFVPMEGAGHGFGGEQSFTLVREFLTRVLGKTTAVKGPVLGRTTGQIPLNKPVQNTPPQQGRGQRQMQQDGDFWLPEKLPATQPVRGVFFLGIGAFQNADWRKLAEESDCALVFTGGDVGPARRDRLLKQVAARTNQPEIEHAGIVLTGLSSGGGSAMLAATEMPDRMIAVIPVHAPVWWAIAAGAESEAKTDVPETKAKLTRSIQLSAAGKPPLLDVPLLFVGASDDSITPRWEWSLHNGNKHQAIWSCYVQPGSEHATMGDLTFAHAWLKAVIKLRVPAEIPIGKPYRLNKIERKSGWLGTYQMSGNGQPVEWPVNRVWKRAEGGTPQAAMQKTSYSLANAKITPYADFTGDQARAIWLPNEEIAKQWLEDHQAKAARQ